MLPKRAAAPSTRTGSLTCDDTVELGSGCRLLQHRQCLRLGRQQGLAQREGQLAVDGVHLKDTRVHLVAHLTRSTRSQRQGKVQEVVQMLWYDTHRRGVVRGR